MIKSLTPLSILSSYAKSIKDIVWNATSMRLTSRVSIKKLLISSIALSSKHSYRSYCTSTLS